MLSVDWQINGPFNLKKKKKKKNKNKRGKEKNTCTQTMTLLTVPGVWHYYVNLDKHGMLTQTDTLNKTKMTTETPNHEMVSKLN